MAYVSKKPVVLSFGMLAFIGLDIFLYSIFAPLPTFLACMSVIIIFFQFYFTAAIAEAMSVESYTVSFDWFMNFFRSEDQKRNVRAKKRYDEMEAMVNNVLYEASKDGSEEAIERATRIINFLDNRRVVELNMILNPEKTLPQLAAPGELDLDNIPKNFDPTDRSFMVEDLLEEDGDLTMS